MSIEELRAQIDLELQDPKYIRCRHYSRKTYDKGCRGPLCGQAASEYHAALRLKRTLEPPRPNSRGQLRREIAPQIRDVAREKGVLEPVS